ncbi:MAG: hypothetical protein U1E65_21315 [Myxococcota bacterium]
MRYGLLILIWALGSGCAGPWLSASAAAVPNPVLLGPVRSVRGAPPNYTPTIGHRLGMLTASMAVSEQSRSQVSSSRATRIAGELALSVEILDAIGPHGDEPYRISDVVEIGAIRVINAENTRGSSSDSYLLVSLGCLSETLGGPCAHLFHLEPQASP